MRCCERTRAPAILSARSHLPTAAARGSAWPHLRSRVSRGRAGTVPTSSHSHGAMASSPDAGSFTSLLNNLKGTAHAVLTPHPQNRHRGAFPERERQRGAGGRHPPSPRSRLPLQPRSLCGRPGRKAVGGGGRAAPLTMSRAGGAV